MKLPTVAAIVVVGCLTLSAQLTWAAPISMGVVGDSLGDEYSEQNYGAYAQNWVQQLAQYDNINFGRTAAAAGQPGGTWGEPRRTGFEFNWARYGSNSTQMLSSGQHTGLAAQIGSKQIPYAVLSIGANDFFPSSGSAYANIYNGTWTQGQINNYVNQSVTNVRTALNAILPTGADTVLVNFPDYGVAPYTSAPTNIGGAGFTNAARRQLVSNVIDGLNSQLRVIAQNDHLALVDLNEFAKQIYGSNDNPHSTLVLGGVNITLTGLASIDSGSNPTGGSVQDGIHPNTTIQGILANTIVTALNIGYNANISLFTEQQILQHKGLAYGGSDTLAGQIGPYSNYVVNFVPEPSTLILGIAGLAGLGLVALRKKFRRV